MARPKKKPTIKDLYTAGPSELNDGKCAFILTQKSKFAGVTFRLAGAEVNEDGKLVFQYEILYCPRAVKINDALSKEIGRVLDDIHSNTTEIENVQAE